MARKLARSRPRLAAMESVASVSRKVGEDGAGLEVGVAVRGGLKAVGSGQEVGESDAARPEKRDEPTGAGDAGAALDPL